MTDDIQLKSVPEGAEQLRRALFEAMEVHADLGKETLVGVMAYTMGQILPHIPIPPEVMMMSIQKNLTMGIDSTQQALIEEVQDDV